MYHAALILHRKSNNKYFAQLQLASDVDCLYCELYLYYGQYDTSKKKTIDNLHDPEKNQALLVKIQKSFPTKNIVKLCTTLF